MNGIPTVADQFVPDGGVRLKDGHPPPPPLEGLIVRAKVFVFVVQVSLTADLTVYVPAEPVAGVPDIELPEQVSPLGHEGDTVIVHEYGVFPPDASMVAV